MGFPYFLSNTLYYTYMMYMGNLMEENIYNLYIKIIFRPDIFILVSEIYLLKSRASGRIVC